MKAVLNWASKGLSVTATHSVGVSPKIAPHKVLSLPYSRDVFPAVVGRFIIGIRGFA